MQQEMTKGCKEHVISVFVMEPGYHLLHFMGGQIAEACDGEENLVKALRRGACGLRRLMRSSWGTWCCGAGTGDWAPRDRGHGDRGWGTGGQGRGRGLWAHQDEEHLVVGGGDGKGGWGAGEGRWGAGERRWGACGLCYCHIVHMGSPHTSQTLTNTCLSCRLCKL
jgi:hypothetical protein